MTQASLDVAFAPTVEAVRAALARRRPLRIGDQEVVRDPAPTRDPATGDVVAEVDLAVAADVDAAVQAAQAAFDGPWSALDPAEREQLVRRFGDLIEAHGDELAVIETLDNGMPLAAARRSVERAAAHMRYMAGWATRIHGDVIEPSKGQTPFHAYTRHEPLGVVAAIVSWNSPLSSTVLKTSAALAAGCTVVLKPASETPLSALRLGELALDAGIPPGVVTVLPGRGSVVGDALVRHPGVRKISFTGSTEVGLRLVADSAPHLPHLTLELGGKSPSIVCADVDLDEVVPQVAWAVFRNSGQICVAGSRIIVDRRIHDELVERLAAFARELRVGPGLDPSSQLGPLISPAQTETVLDYVATGRAEGGRLVTGGEQLAGDAHRSGQFVAPAVFADVAENGTIMREEIFGPVVVVSAFDGIEDAIRRANDTDYGLASGIWTDDLDAAHTLAASLRAGMVWVNGYAEYDPALPFGGRQLSGYGAKSGREAVLECTELKTVTVRLGRGRTPGGASDV